MFSIISHQQTSALLDPKEAAGVRAGRVQPAGISVGSAVVPTRERFEMQGVSASAWWSRFRSSPRVGLRSWWVGRSMDVTGSQHWVALDAVRQGYDIDAQRMAAAAHFSRPM